MARVVKPAEGLEMTSFEEPSFGTPGARVVDVAPPELVTPEELVRRAQEQAAAIRAEAETDGERLRQTAEAAGRTAGEEAGRTELFDRKAAAVAVVEALGDSVRDDAARVTRELTDSVLQVAVAVVRRLFGDLVEAHPDVMRHVVSEALGAMTHRARVTVRVHPSVVAIVEEHRATLLRIYADVEDLQLVSDDAVPAGGCIVDADTIVIDATVDRLLDRVVDQLRVDDTDADAPVTDGDA